MTGMLSTLPESRFISVRMTVYQKRLDDLAAEPRDWTVTGVAGFIGSNILQRLLVAGQRVIGLDNFVTGSRRNLRDVEAEVGPERWRNFRFLEGDIRDLSKCQAACKGSDFVLHQAALGSVPLSIERPDDTHAVNVTGFLNVLQAAREGRVGRFVYASSCAVYGDDAGSPKIEDRLGRSLSPYATTKRIDELYADVFSRCYDRATVGLRYFNVYGSRQDPNGAYAAVIPKWLAALSQGEAITIYGDGKTSRDFCFVQDVVQANILAATAPISGDLGSAVLNIGTGTETSLNELFAAMRDIVVPEKGGSGQVEPIYKDFRPGDVRYSCADISSARRLLGYAPAYDLRQGLADLVAWDAAQEKPEIART